ncbi:MAG: DUF3710 domain-containing protein [Candidatus Nanopelagicales bacterium]
MFNKKKRDDSADEANLTDQDTTTPEVANASESTVEDTSDATEVNADAPRAIDVGPIDIADYVPDGVDRIDFGAIKVPGIEQTQYNLEVDQETDVVVAVTALREDGAVQLQPFAAPKAGDFWPEVKSELRDGLIEQGGKVEEITGTFGEELRAEMPAEDEEGNEGIQIIRFVGVEGPRWLVRAVFLGAPAVDERAAEVFEDLVRACVVERGNAPMAPGDLLALQIPEGAEAAPEELAEDGERPPLDPFERGPEITEIR